MGAKRCRAALVLPQTTVIRSFFHNFSEGLLEIFSALSKLRCPALLNKDSGRTGVKFQQAKTLQWQHSLGLSKVQEHLMPLRSNINAEAQISAPYPHHSQYRHSNQKDVNSKEIILQQCIVSPNSAAVHHALLRLVCLRFFRNRAGNAAQPQLSLSY